MKKRNIKIQYFMKNIIYISNFCLPYGYKNKSFKNEDNSMCNKTDYNTILKFFYSFFTNNYDTNIDSLILNKNSMKLKSSDILIGIFSIIILLIPIILKLFLIISRCIIDKRNKNIHKINKLIFY